MTYEAWKADRMADHAKMKPVYAARPVEGRRMALERPGKEPVELFFFPARRKNAPLLLNMHGGGYTGGDAVLMDSFCALVNRELDMAVANINYKKTPEYAFPYAVEEVADALAVFAARAGEFGIDPARMAVAGASAGGGIAAGAALKAVTEGIPLAMQLLIYPCTDSTEDNLMNQGYCQHGDAAHPYASPLLAPEEMVKALPPTVFLGCGVDSLNPQYRAYAMKLMAAGVDVTFRNWAEAEHGFIEVNRPDYFFEDSRKGPEQAHMSREAERYCLFMLREILG